MSAAAVKSQCPSPLKQLRMARVSSWLGPSSGNTVVAVLLAAQEIGAGDIVNISPTAAKPVARRIIVLTVPFAACHGSKQNLARDYSSEVTSTESDSG